MTQVSILRWSVRGKLSIKLWKWLQDFLFSHCGSLTHWAQHVLHPVQAGALAIRRACNSTLLSRAALSITSLILKTVDLWIFDLWLLQPRCLLLLKTIITVWNILRLRTQHHVENKKRSTRVCLVTTLFRVDAFPGNALCLSSWITDDKYDCPFIIKSECTCPFTKKSWVTYTINSARDLISRSFWNRSSTVHLNSLQGKLGSIIKIHSLPFKSAISLLGFYHTEIQTYPSAPPDPHPNSHCLPRPKWLSGFKSFSVKFLKYHYLNLSHL